MNKPLLLTIGLIAITGFMTWRVFDICADYNNTCSPTPTSSYVTISPNASPSATLSPVVPLGAQVGNPTPITCNFPATYPKCTVNWDKNSLTCVCAPQDTPVPTSETQINSAVSANNESSPNAGASASVTAPTGAPDTSLRQ